MPMDETRQIHMTASVVTCNCQFYIEINKCQWVAPTFIEFTLQIYK